MARECSSCSSPPLSASPSVIDALSVSDSLTQIFRWVYWWNSTEELPEAIGEVARAGNIFKFFAGEALRVGGEVVPSVRPGIGIEVTREPVGVVGLITPWNFPIAIPAWKIAPALACGNTVVMKPAELVPGCAWAIADILQRIGTSVASELDTERIVQMVTDEVTALTGANFGAFFYNVVNDDGNAYMLYTISGAPREAFEKFPMPRATEVFGRRRGLTGVELLGVQ